MEGPFSCQVPAFSTFLARGASSKKFSVESFGCKVNQYDAQLLREALSSAGLTPAAPDQHPDLILVNTCTVTAGAEREARQALRRARRRCPGATILAAGCYARQAGAGLREQGLADGVVERPDPSSLLDSLGAGPGPAMEGISAFAGHTRAFVKVQDGCDRSCSFCVVPLVRGRSVSREAGEVAAEVSRLVAAGAPEVVLCGVRLNAYRDPGTGKGLTALLARLLSLDLPVRFRLSSLYPGGFDPGLLAMLTREPRVCRHAHIPVQSGSDAVLGAMGRGYSAAEVLSLVRELKASAPEMGLTADILVGFPGETDEDHERTLELVRESGFSRLHLFPFSPRPGTRAAGFSPVPRPKVRERMDELRILEKRLREAALDAQIGREEEVVIESSDGGPGAGRGTTGNYHRARVGAPHCRPGSLVRVRVTGRHGGELECVTAGAARG